MKTKGPSTLQTEDKKTPQATSTKASPTYIGFRVNRYTPEVTRVAAVSGFRGCTVVFARRKAARPAMATATPPSAIAIVVVKRILSGRGVPGDTSVTPHIAAAMSSPTIGGGILSSS